jgi:hypothetical protein
MYDVCVLLITFAQGSNKKLKLSYGIKALGHLAGAVRTKKKKEAPFSMQRADLYFILTLAESLVHLMTSTFNELSLTYSTCLTLLALCQIFCHLHRESPNSWSCWCTLPGPLLSLSLS